MSSLLKTTSYIQNQAGQWVTSSQILPSHPITDTPPGSGHTTVPSRKEERNGHWEFNEGGGFRVEEPNEEENDDAETDAFDTKSETYSNFERRHRCPGGSKKETSQR